MVEALDFLGYTSDLFVRKSDFRLVGLEAGIVHALFNQLSRVIFW